MITKFALKPGFNKNIRQPSAEGYWYDGDKVRFIGEIPVRIGSWAKAYETQLYGKGRAILSWSTLNGLVNVAIGTNEKLYVYQGGSLYNITPFRATATLVDPFSVTNASSTIAVTDTAHGAVEGDWITVDGPATVGGITIDGDYSIDSITDADEYVITGATTASGTTVGGGTIDVNYEVAVGLEDGIMGVGFGAGPFGSGTFGTSREGATGILLYPRLWSLDQWGEDLVACYNGGKIYYWDSSLGTTTRADTISSNAPIVNNTILVTPERFLCTYGTIDPDTSNYDPLLIRWCSQEDYDVWAASSTNTAGQYRLSYGKEILAAVKARGQILVFTDVALWSQNFLGTQDVWGFELIGPDAGIVSKNAFAYHDGIVFWMGKGNFYMYDGGIRAIPCPMSEFVFNRLNIQQMSKVFAAADDHLAEIWFFYPDEDSLEVNRYVMYNTRQGAWVSGSFNRTCWLDSGAHGDIIAMSDDRYLYNHEIADRDAGEDFDAFIESGYFDLGDGDRLFFLDKVIPDICFTGLNGPAEQDGDFEITITLTAKQYPHSQSETTKGPYIITRETTKVDTRLRGRIMKLRFDSDASADMWGISSVRINIQPDGGR